MSIKVENINFSFKDKKILEGLNFELNKNEVVLVYGHIGVGKSTLIYLLSGLLKGFNGKVTWEDLSFTKISKKLDRVRNQYMSMNLSNFYYIKDMHVEDNIVFPAVYANKDKKYISKRLEYIYDAFSDIKLTPTESFNLKDYRHKKIATMSNGQREIVMMARMLINDSSYIVADEMLRSFNKDVKKQIWDILVDKFGIGVDKALFLITHDDEMVNYRNINRVFDFHNKTLKQRES